MAKTPLENFLDDCVARDLEGEGLSLEELYGLYLSWCALEGSTPVRSRAFKAGLRGAGIRFGRPWGRCPGLAMAGPAAYDYLVHRELPLVDLDAPAIRPRLKSPPATEPASSFRPPRAGEARSSEPAA